MSARSVEVSVVLPAYNEEETIRHTVEATLETLAAFLPSGSFEVLIAEDGCDDRTPEIAATLADADERVQHVHSEGRLGRGGALERAFHRAAGDTLVYFDTDLATDMRHLEELVESVRTGPYDVATGSRHMAGHRAARPAKRSVPSSGFNALVRTILRSELRDHQCGFKAFDREVLFALLEDVQDDHWFWDTEVLVRAQRDGYRIKEFPVDWTPKGDTKVDLVRDVFGMGSQIVRLWWQLSVRPRITQRTSMVAGSVLALLALALMTLYLDPWEVLDAARNADPALVALAGVVYVVSWPLRGLRYQHILQTLGYHERVGQLTGAIFISQTGNLVVPARMGDAIRAYLLKARRGIPYPSGFASLAVERVFDLLTISIFGAVMFLWLAASGTIGDVQSVAFESGGETRESGRIALTVAVAVAVAAVLLLVAIVASARSDRDFVRSALARASSDSYVEYLSAVLGQFVRDVQTVTSERRAFAVVGANSVVIWSIDVLTAVIVLAAMDVGVPPGLLFVTGFFAVSVGNLAKVLPLSPGGIGLYEGAFTVLVVALTPVGGAVALAAAIVDHAVKNVVTIAGGVVSMIVLNVSLTTAVEESREAVDAEVGTSGE